MAMRHSIQERMSMTKETLKLKSKSRDELPVASCQALAGAPIAAGRNTGLGKSKKGLGVTRLLEAAINYKVYVFIQLRHGAGYRGLPTMLEDGWLTIRDAEIFGTKQNMCVAELLIQVKDGSYIAHLHTVSPESSKQPDESLGELQ
jgi:hypothetical protein